MCTSVCPETFDHTTFDADALPHVISALRAQRYSFVTLDALTG